MINGIWGLPLSSFVTACIHYITLWTLNSIRCKTGIIIIHSSPLSGLNWNNTCKVLKSSSFIVTCSFPCFLDNLKMHGTRLAISHFPYVTCFFLWNLVICFKRKPQGLSFNLLTECVYPHGSYTDDLVEKSVLSLWMMVSRGFAIP